MRKLLLALLILTLPLTAGAWTLPVPSGMTAGDQVYAINGSTLGVRGSLVTTCASETWTAGASPTFAGKSCVLITIAGAVEITSFSEVGAVAGQLLTLVNVSNQNLTITEDSGTVEGQTTVLAQYDAAAYIYTGTTWVQLSLGNN